MFPVWDELVQSLYRDIFEPLSRNAAYVDGTDNEVTASVELEQVSPYGKTLASYWYAIHGQLRHNYDGNLDEIEATMDEIVDNILSFLMTLGISCQKTEEELWQVSFTSSNFTIN